MLIKFTKLIVVCPFYLPLRGVLSIVRGSGQGLVCRVFTTSPNKYASTSK